MVETVNLLLEQTLGGSKEKGKSKIFRFLTFGIAIASLVMSIIGLSLGNKGYLESSLFSYQFPNWADFMVPPVGSVVSLDFDGKAMIGAGTTIARDAYVETAFRTNVKIWNLNPWLYVSASDGKIKIYEVDPADITIEHGEYDLKINGQNMIVSNFVRLSNETFVVMSSTYLYPFSITWTVKQMHDVDVSLVFGEPAILPTGSHYPKIDTLDETHICLSYEGGDNMIYALTADVVKDSTGKLRISTNAPKAFSEIYGFHGIAGLSKSNFIVTATGPKFNTSGIFRQQLRATLVTINSQDGSLSFGNWTTLPFSMSFNFFDMDNFDDRYVVVAYVNALNNNGIECVLLNYDRSSNSIYWGTSMTYKSSGAISDYNKIVLSMLTPDRLALTYNDAAAHNSVVLGMIELTRSGDLVKSGPEFVIARPSRDSTQNKFYFDTCHGAPWRFVTIESFQNDTQAVTRLHVGSYLPRPVGVVNKNLFGSSLIQFAGTVSVNQKLTPGYMYYANANGEMKRGRPAGFAHREFGAFYVTADDRSLLSLHNQIGIAVGEHDLLIKMY